MCLIGCLGWAGNWRSLLIGAAKYYAKVVGEAPKYVNHPIREAFLCRGLAVLVR